jgi:thiol-disulfide isomerase/thioredoxin
MAPVRFFLIGLNLAAWSGLPGDEPDAAALVRQVRGQESWIDQVESIQIKAVIEVDKSSKAIEQRRRQLQEQRASDTDIANDRYMQPRYKWFVDQAYNRSRLRSRVLFESEWEELEVWDGKRFVTQWRGYPTPPGDRSLIRRGSEWAMVWAYFSSFRAGPHSFWWHLPEQRSASERTTPKPEDFAYEGQFDFHGAACHVVSHWDSWTSLFIGVEDGRLHGIRLGASTTRRFERSLIELYRLAGRPIRDEIDLANQSASFTAAERKKVSRLGSARLSRLIDPCFEYRLALNREIAPGCRLPMRQWYRFFEVDQDGQPYESEVHDLKVLEAEVNEPLPDSLFTVAFKEGERINDETTDPPVSYHYKAGMTRHDWSEIMADAKKRARKELKREREQARQLNQPAAEFPPGATWLNSRPLTMKELRGRAVVLHFWAEWCGPCQTDLPTLGALHEKRPGDLVVIGVHPPGSEPAAIRSIMKEFEVEVPLCADVWSGDCRTSWGALFDAFRVDRIPHSVLIDRQGRIAATGDLTSVTHRAAELGLTSR